jgi:hypothetical protein
LSSYQPTGASYKVIWIARLPQIDLPLEKPPCMLPPISWPRRMVRQLIPRRQLRDCCMYHATDWHSVSRATIRIARQAARRSVASEEWEDRLMELTAKLPEPEREAAQSLLWPGAGIDIGRLAGQRQFSYADGRHRARAMMDAGVRRTVVTHWHWPDDKPWWRRWQSVLKED